MSSGPNHLVRAEGAGGAAADAGDRRSQGQGPVAGIIACGMGSVFLHALIVLICARTWSSSSESETEERAVPGYARSGCV